MEEALEGAFRLGLGDVCKGGRAEQEARAPLAGASEGERGDRHGGSIAAGPEGVVAESASSDAARRPEPRRPRPLGAPDPGAPRVSAAAPRELHLTGEGEVRLRADAWGDPEAPPALFLHGGGQTRHAWGRTASALAHDGWHAVALDLRGHGESDWAPDGDYRLGAFRADLERVIAGFAKPPALVGASLGGLAILLAAESPRFTARAVVLVDVAPRLEREGTQRIVEFMTERPGGFA